MLCSGRVVRSRPQERWCAGGASRGKGEAAEGTGGLQADGVAVRGVAVDAGPSGQPAAAHALGDGHPAGAAAGAAQGGADAHAAPQGAAAAEGGGDRGERRRRDGQPRVPVPGAHDRPRLPGRRAAQHLGQLQAACGRVHLVAAPRRQRCRRRRALPAEGARAAQGLRGASAGRGCHLRGDRPRRAQRAAVQPAGGARRAAALCGVAARRREDRARALARRGGQQHVLAAQAERDQEEEDLPRGRGGGHGLGAGAVQPRCDGDGEARAAREGHARAHRDVLPRAAQDGHDAARLQ
mmetsp:Transcript_16753/g.39869  ORF Transcript_16753/g.39869 Transcript_16753/m.39869 type:complete len:295 (-) Transcript_16753:220-1104(-)